LFKEWKEQSDPIKYKLAAGYLEVSQDRMTSCLYCQGKLQNIKFIYTGHTKK